MLYFHFKIVFLIRSKSLHATTSFLRYLFFFLFLVCFLPMRMRMIFIHTFLGCSRLFLFSWLCAELHITMASFALFFGSSVFPHIHTPSSSHKWNWDYYIELLKMWSICWYGKGMHTEWVWQRERNRTERKKMNMASTHWMKQRKKKSSRQKQQLFDPHWKIRTKLKCARKTHTRTHFPFGHILNMHYTFCLRFLLDFSLLPFRTRDSSFSFVQSAHWMPSFFFDWTLNEWHFRKMLPNEENQFQSVLIFRTFSFAAKLRYNIQIEHWIERISYQFQ